MVNRKTIFEDNGKVKLYTIMIMIITTLVLPPMFFVNADALLQVGGSTNIDIQPGQSDVFAWGLFNEHDITIQVQLSAVGEGSEFLTFDEILTLSPKQLVYPRITVNIPDDYSGGIELRPMLTAAELNEGDSSINLKMARYVNLNIAPNDGSNISIDSNPTESVQQVQESSTSDETKAEQQVPESSTSDPIESVQQVPESSTSDPIESVQQVPESSTSDPIESVQQVPESSTSDPIESVQQVPESSTSDPTESVQQVQESSTSDATKAVQQVHELSTTVALTVEIVESKGEFTAAAQTIPADIENIPTNEVEYELSTLIEENQRLKKVIKVLNEQIAYLNQLIQSIQILVDGTIFS